MRYVWGGTQVNRRGNLKERVRLENLKTDSREILKLILIQDGRPQSGLMWLGVGTNNRFFFKRKSGCINAGNSWLAEFLTNDSAPWSQLFKCTKPVCLTVLNCTYCNLIYLRNVCGKAVVNVLWCRVTQLLGHQLHFFHKTLLHWTEITVN